MKLRMLVLPFLMLPLAACEDMTNSGSNYSNASVQPQTTRYGTVIDARTLVVSNKGNETAGAVVGGLAGAVVGNQFGKGTGKAVMTGAGAVGGAMLGSEIAKQNSGTHTTTEWTVRLDNGQVVSFRQAVQGIAIGSRVTVQRYSNGAWQIVL